MRKEEDQIEIDQKILLKKGLMSTESNVSSFGTDKTAKQLKKEAQKAARAARRAEEESKRQNLFRLVRNGKFEETLLYLNEQSATLNYTERESERGTAGNTLLHCCVHTYQY